MKNLRNPVNLHGLWRVAWGLVFVTGPVFLGCRPGPKAPCKKGDGAGAARAVWISWASNHTNEILLDSRGAARVSMTGSGPDFVVACDGEEVARVCDAVPGIIRRAHYATSAPAGRLGGAFVLRWGGGDDSHVVYIRPGDYSGNELLTGVHREIQAIAQYELVEAMSKQRWAEDVGRLGRTEEAVAKYQAVFEQLDDWYLNASFRAGRRGVCIDEPVVSAARESLRDVPGDRAVEVLKACRRAYGEALRYILRIDARDVGGVCVVSFAEVPWMEPPRRRDVDANLLRTWLGPASKTGSTSTAGTRPTER